MADARTITPTSDDDSGPTTIEAGEPSDNAKKEAAIEQFADQMQKRRMDQFVAFQRQNIKSNESQKPVEQSQASFEELQAKCNTLKAQLVQSNEQATEEMKFFMRFLVHNSFVMDSKLQKNIESKETKLKEQHKHIEHLQGVSKSQIAAVEVKIQQLQEMVESQKEMALKLRKENDRLKVRRFNDKHVIHSMKAAEQSHRQEVAKVRSQMDAMMDAIFLLITHGSAENDEEEELVDDEYFEEELVDDDDDTSTVGPTEEITCPLTREVFIEPVIDYEGNTYEKDAILEWLKTNETSPITRNELTEDQLVSNRVLKNLISALAYD